MSFLNKLKSAASQGFKNLSEEVTKFKNKEFLDGTMAICAWVSAADGNISSEEKSKMNGFVKQSDALKHYDQNKVIERFNYFAEKFEFDASIGKGEALSVIQKAVAKDASCARMLVMVGLSIAKSDGHFDIDEKKVLQEVCVALGFEPKEFDL
jgi:tellurite resistance protein TerB